MISKIFNVSLLKNKKHSSYQELFQEWQEQMFKIDFIILIASAFIEFCFFIFYMKNGLSDLSIFKHLYLYFLRPLSLNSIFFIIFLRIYNSDKVSQEIKILLPMFLMTIIFSVIISIHYVFPTLYLIWIIPIFISVIYANNKIERAVFNFSIVCLTISFISTLFDKYSERPNRFLFHVAITYVLIFVVHIIIKKMIFLENLKEEILDKSLVENYKLSQKLLHDGLTKLYNHTALFAELDESILNFNENDKFYLAVLDIDFFKKINDTYGHETGNFILVKLGKILNKYKSENIFPARYGGEEFAIVFKNLDLPEILTILNDIRYSFSFENEVFVNNKKISLSIGISKYEKGLNSKDFFAKSDKFLYDAKNSGRDTIKY